jgi:hypothetical protein
MLTDCGLIARRTLRSLKLLSRKRMKQSMAEAVAKHLKEFVEYK